MKLIISGSSTSTTTHRTAKQIAVFYPEEKAKIEKTIREVSPKIKFSIKGKTGSNHLAIYVTFKNEQDFSQKEFKALLKKIELKYKLPDYVYLFFRDTSGFDIP